ncbi:hypothetical protein ACVBIL_13135 [Shewanella sp. 125m-7]
MSTVLFTFPVYSLSNEAIKVEVDKTPQQLAIFSQTFNFSLPLDWKLAFTNQQDDMFSAEFVPASQTLQTWSSMLCVQGFKGLTEDISPQAFLQTMAEVYFESCQGESVFEALASEPLNDHQTASAIIGCTNMPNSHINSVQGIAYGKVLTQGEIGHYTAVRGEQDLYLIHKSIRGEVFTKENPPIKAQNYQEFLSTIMPLSLY